MSDTTPGIVHLVDDDASFLGSMSRLLRASGHEVRTYSSADDFLNRAGAGARGCVVADLRMPGKSGFDLQDALTQAGCPMPVVFVTAHGDIPASVRAMRHGAEDFLTKRAPKEQLLAAVARALERGARESSRSLRLRDLQQRLERLTPREREVLELVVKGRMNKEIADELAIHERTVKLHRTAITSKLQVHSVAELTAIVLETRPGFAESGSAPPGTP